MSAPNDRFQPTYLPSLRCGKSAAYKRGVDQTAEPQVNLALDALSPLDAVSRARLGMTVGEALGEQFLLIIDRPPDCSVHDRRPVTFQFLGR